ncbi:MAG: helix-turn-helix transcriptional regulator [Novosphingobium sp.]
MPRPLNSPRYDALREGIRAARKERGMTQVEVAKALGRPQSYVADFERRERRIDVVEYLALAEAIGFDPLSLLADVMKI